jgi:DNA-binding MarR family transcriptional regulator
VERRETGKTEDVNIMLGVLSAIERDSRVTQRNLAQELQVALGLVNALLKRCAKKGYVKIRQAPLNRYAYYLTPRGFAEKSRLTAEYLTFSLQFFRDARRDSAVLFAQCRNRAWRRVVLYGAGELTEIAILSAGEADVAILCVIDATSGALACAGRPVVTDLDKAFELAGADGIDAIIVTDAAAPQARYEAALAAAAGHAMSEDRVLALDLLRVVSPTARAGK